MFNSIKNIFHPEQKFLFEKIEKNLKAGREKEDQEIIHHHIDYIVLDDDPFNDYGLWEPLSLKLKFTYRYYNCPFQLSEEIHHYSKKTPLFFDSYLKNNLNGEIIAKFFFAIGYQEISLVTDRDMNQFKNRSMPWIKSFFSKDLLDEILREKIKRTP